MEVPFESSGGTALERSLGSNATVLNLGVEGYGVDQTVLRYERDARARKPDVAILGPLDHDLLRTLSVYSFVTFPEWGLPFSKPRYASYAIRFLRSRFRPLLALDNDPHGRELEQLSAALISRFISITKSDGTIPLPVSAVPWPGTDCYC